MEHALEIAQGERFQFGANWTQFLSLLNDDRIEQAKTSLLEMLRMESLEGKSFLDIGSGSGLFSLAAKRLGARVYSFDYDPKSVACTRELKRRYYANDPDWMVEEGSVLDKEYLSTLGVFDVVYSWGVLHHTGDQWGALENVAPIVRENGHLFIALYNDQGLASRVWRRVKKAYVRLGKLGFLVLWPSFVRLRGPACIRDLLVGRPFYSWRHYSSRRGMSPWHDVVDWVGGYPFEVSKPEQVFTFYRDKGFELVSLVTCGGRLGCNQYVFLKKPSSKPA